MRQLFLLLWLGAGAQAQVPGITVTTEPATPTVTTPVTVVIRSQCGCPTHVVPINRNGFTLDVPYNPLCLSPCGPDSVQRYEVGRLEQGIYTVRQYPEGGSPDDLRVIGTFAVVNAPIPTFGVEGTIAIVVALSLIALVVVRR